MKPRPASPNDLRAPQPQKPGDSKEGNNILGIIVTTIIGTALVIVPMWAMHQHHLKKQLTTIKKQLDEAEKNLDIANPNS